MRSGIVRVWRILNSTVVFCGFFTPWLFDSDGLEKLSGYRLLAGLVREPEGFLWSVLLLVVVPSLCLLLYSFVNLFAGITTTNPRDRQWLHEWSLGIAAILGWVFVTNKSLSAGMLGAWLTMAGLASSLVLEISEAAFPWVGEEEQDTPEACTLQLGSIVHFTLEIVIAIGLAKLIWGAWEWQELLGDIVLPAAGVTALYVTFKAYVFVVFGRVSYLNVFSSFAGGLWMYNWLLTTSLPTEWVSYWWLPFLILIPFTVTRQIPGPSLEHYLPERLFRFWSILVMVILSPFLLMYMFVPGLLHPRQTLRLIGRHSSLVSTVGILACSTAVTLLHTDLDPLLSLLCGIIVFFVIWIVSIAVMLLSSRLSTKSGLMVRFLWVLVLSVGLPILMVIGKREEGRQTAESGGHDDAVTMLSLSVGTAFFVFLGTLLIPRFLSLAVLPWCILVYMVTVGGSLFVSVARPVYAGSRLHETVMLLARFVTAPFWLVGVLATKYA